MACTPRAAHEWALARCVSDREALDCPVCTTADRIDPERCPVPVLCRKDSESAPIEPWLIAGWDPDNNSSACRFARTQAWLSLIEKVRTRCQGKRKCRVKVAAEMR